MRAHIEILSTGNAGTTEAGIAINGSFRRVGYRMIDIMCDKELPTIEYTSEKTDVGSHHRKYICIRGVSLAECYEYFIRVRDCETS
jgi:hypothetical protein